MIVEDLTPSDTATMDKSKVKGFITKVGGRTSHTAIMARTLEIPAIVGCGDLLDVIKDDDFIAMNGEEGVFEINPSDDVLSSYELKQKEELEYKELLKNFIGKESISMDGKKVE